jgi:predicted RNA binding protein YcfA (HicA-like mRNA interferase family)
LRQGFSFAGTFVGSCNPPHRDPRLGGPPDRIITVKGTLDQKKAIKLLQEHGWTRKTGGKHQVKMTKPGERPITLPMNKGRDYPKGLAAAILRQAGLQ